MKIAYYAPAGAGKSNLVYRERMKGVSVVEGDEAFATFYRSLNKFDETEKVRRWEKLMDFLVPQGYYDMFDAVVSANEHFIELLVSQGFVRRNVSKIKQEVALTEVFDKVLSPSSKVVDLDQDTEAVSKEKFPKSAWKYQKEEDF
jgi:hypothetical protein